MDYRLEQWINGAAGAQATRDAFMRRAASWSEPAFILLIVGWFIVGWARGRSDDRQGAITAGVAAALALLVNQIIILFWQRDRPFVAHPRSVHVLLSHSGDPSFPSDHAAPAFAIAVAFLLLHRRLGLLALLWAAVMAYARVYCGDHYPADVIAGALIGAVVAVALSTQFAGVMEFVRRQVDRVMAAIHLPSPDQRQPAR